MIHVILSVRDAKSEIFGRPFFMSTVGMAIRAFDDEINSNKQDNIMAQHPEDFALYQLGSFEDNSGTFESMIPKLIVQGNEVKKKA